MPNSGYPLSVNGRTLFIDNETYFADKMVQMYQQGVKILGGCCGTTPNHIKAVAQYLQTVSYTHLHNEVLCIRNECRHNVPS